jgi:hypothetical protein
MLAATVLQVYAASSAAASWVPLVKLDQTFASCRIVKEPRSSRRARRTRGSYHLSRLLVMFLSYPDCRDVSSLVLTVFDFFLEFLEGTLGAFPRVLRMVFLLWRTYGCCHG